MAAKADIRLVALLGSRLRGNDECEALQCFTKLFPVLR